MSQAGAEREMAGRRPLPSHYELYHRQQPRGCGTLCMEAQSQVTWRSGSSQAHPRPRRAKRGASHRGVASRRIAEVQHAPQAGLPHPRGYRPPLQCLQQQREHVRDFPNCDPDGGSDEHGDAYQLTYTCGRGVPRLGFSAAHSTEAQSANWWRPRSLLRRTDQRFCVSFRDLLLRPRPRSRHTLLGGV
jgi:hypothetical protein